MENIQGLVEHIIYRNEDNGYTVMSVQSQGKDIVCVGAISALSEGEYIKAEGEFVDHPSYGEQFKIQSYSLEMPEDIFSIERYLGSGAIRGMGPALASRVVKKFKQDTFRIIEEEPERLAEIKGISERKAREIYEQFHDKQDMRQAMMFLGKYGITTAYAVKIYNEYGNRLYDIIRENPYQLAEVLRASALSWRTPLPTRPVSARTRIIGFGAVSFICCFRGLYPAILIFLQIF